MRPEIMTSGTQLLAQFAIVVDFAVVDNGKPTVAAEHGLVATFAHIDNRQAVLANGHLPPRSPHDLMAAVVGAAMTHAVQRRNKPLSDGEMIVSPESTSNPAHG
jgi:hypothetical protein